MKTLGIIPSRFASTRFPGKPLININGKSMIQRVYEQAIKASALSDAHGHDFNLQDVIIIQRSATILL